MVELKNGSAWKKAILTFDDGYTTDVRVRRTGNKELQFILAGETYVVVADPNGEGTRSTNPEGFGPDSSFQLTTQGIPINPGESTIVYGAEDVIYQDFGGSIGNLTKNSDTADFEAQIGVSAYVIGYRASTADVYLDLDVGAGASRIDVEYDYDYAWANGALGGASTTVEGSFIIRDLDQGTNLTKDEFFGNSGSFYEIRTGSGSGRNITSALVDGGGNYRIGIRGFVEVDAYATGFSSADISNSGDKPGYIDLTGVTVSVS